MQLAIIGAGQAACTLIAELVRGNFEGHITVFNGEGITPYQRPPLSKTPIENSLSPERNQLLPPQVLTDPRITWINMPVDTLDPDTGEVTAGNTTQDFDHLVIATGTRAIRPPIPGLADEDLQVMRTWTDRLKLAAATHNARHVSLIGAGFMAFELAASLCHPDREIRILARGPRALPQTSAETASWLIKHSAASVLTHCSVEGFEASTQTLQTNQGSIPTDCIIATVGSTPNVELLTPHGLADADGITVDALMQTPHPRVSAIGEVCRHHHPSLDRTVRIESISEANDTATVLAKRLLGQPMAFHAVPWFWSDQGTQKLQIAGLASRDDEAEILTADDTRQVVLRHQDGRITAVEAVNAATEFMAARRLFERGDIRLQAVRKVGSVMAVLQSSRS